MFHSFLGSRLPHTLGLCSRRNASITRPFLNCTVTAMQSVCSLDDADHPTPVALDADPRGSTVSILGRCANKPAANLGRAAGQRISSFHTWTSQRGTVFLPFQLYYPQGHFVFVFVFFVHFQARCLPQSFLHSCRPGTRPPMPSSLRRHTQTQIVCFQLKASLSNRLTRSKEGSRISSHVSHDLKSLCTLGLRVVPTTALRKTKTKTKRKI